MGKAKKVHGGLELHTLAINLDAKNLGALNCRARLHLLVGPSAGRL